jgi:adenine-specific DNA glycosylase
VEGFADAVLDWYEHAARDLPWRRPDATPWAVLVSELMLQQTPVARVLPAYEAWLRRWPAPPDCAAAPAGEAVRMWGKLGYPRRALRLHEAARAIVDRHGGVVPADLDELLALPGVGAYTARAVASFAYGRRHPVVDTNVRRVVARAVLGQGDAGPPSTGPPWRRCCRRRRPGRPGSGSPRWSWARWSARPGRPGAARARSRRRARGGSRAARRTRDRSSARNASPAPTARCGGC